MSNGTCPFLHAGPYPACPYTYAEILGSSYDNINIIYAIIVIIISTLTFASVAIIVKRRKFTPLDTQKRMFYLSTGLCITLMIRSIEPAGYRLWLPYTLSGLCVDWGSCFLYSLVFTLIHDWIRIVMKITGKQELVKPTEYFFYFLNGFIWILMTVFSVLQSNDDRYYAWRGTKLTVAGTAAALIVILQSYFGWVIFRTLRANEVLHTRTKSQLASPRTKRLESQSTSSSINKPAKPEKLSAGKRSKINRIKYLLILYGVCESIVCIAQFVTASTVVKDRYTLSSPPSPPTGAMDVLTESLFDWAHMLAVALLLVFFHPPLRAENENAKPDDRDDGRSEMRNNERAAQSQGSDKSSKKLSNLEEADENLSGAAADSNNSGDLHIVVSDAGSSGSVRQPLPDGWQELVNEQGVPYYYNARENVTVWERPGGHSIDERSPKETDKLHYGGSSSANPSLSF